MTLTTYINRLFAPRVERRAKPSVHVVNGITITKANGLWTATVDGVTYKNSRLGDLKMQLADL